MRNVLSKVSRKHTKWATFILKAMFAMENRGHALDKAESRGGAGGHQRPQAPAP